MYNKGVARIFPSSTEFNKLVPGYQYTKANCRSKHESSLGEKKNKQTCRYSAKGNEQKTQSSHAAQRRGRGDRSLHEEPSETPPPIHPPPPQLELEMHKEKLTIVVICVLKET